MSKFMDWLKTETSKISENEIFEPKCEVEDDEVVVGTVESLEIKRLFTLIRKLKDEAVGLVKENPEIELFLDGASTKDAKKLKKLKAVKRRLEALSRNVHTLEKLFWAIIHFEISDQQTEKNEDAGHDSVGIREDWKIVSFESKDQGIPSILGALLVGMSR